MYMKNSLMHKAYVHNFRNVSKLIISKALVNKLVSPSVFLFSKTLHSVPDEVVSIVNVFSLRMLNMIPRGVYSACIITEHGKRVLLNIIITEHLLRLE